MRTTDDHDLLLYVAKATDMHMRALAPYNGKCLKMDLYGRITIYNKSGAVRLVWNEASASGIA